jgi:hypothetical protein
MSTLASHDTPTNVPFHTVHTTHTARYSPFTYPHYSLYTTHHSPFARIHTTFMYRHVEFSPEDATAVLGRRRDERAVLGGRRDERAVLGRRRDESTAVAQLRYFLHCASTAAAVVTAIYTRMHSLPPHCPFNVPSLSLQCPFNVPSLSLQCPFNVPRHFALPTYVHDRSPGAGAAVPCSATAAAAGGGERGRKCDGEQGGG